MSYKDYMCAAGSQEAANWIKHITPKFIYTIGPLKVHSHERMTPQEVMHHVASCRRDTYRLEFTGDADEALAVAKTMTTADVREVTLV